MDNKHAIVSEIKQLAQELGRTPCLTEWKERTRFSRRVLEHEFGAVQTWNHAVVAAGLIPTKGRGRVKLTQEEVFGRDIRETLEAHEPRERKPAQVSEPILIIGDAHFPFVHHQTLEKIYRFAEKHRPKHIVQMGDLYDFFAHSKFPRSQNFYSPDQEMAEGRKAAEEMWKTIRGLCPDAKCHQLLGNHDVRPLKRIMESAPTLESLLVRAIEPLFEFEGVQTIKDPRDELVLQGVTMVHGYASRPGFNRDFVLGNCVNAHTHRAGVVYRALREQTIWELNPGFIGDETSKALSYTPQRTTGWTLGWGWIDEYGPRAIIA